MGQVLQQIQKMSDQAYCDYVSMLKTDECRGYEAKMGSGEFGLRELEAHNEAAKLYGRHLAYADAVKIMKLRHPA